LRWEESWIHKGKKTSFEWCTSFEWSASTLVNDCVTRLIIDMQINFLHFSNFIFTSKLIALFISNKSITKQKSLIFIHILKKSITSVTSLVKQLKSCDATLINIKISKLTLNSMKIVMIETVTYKILVKRSNIKIFAVIILKIDWFITIFKNKSEEVNLHELSHVETLKQVKIKLLSEYHDYLDVFNWAMTDQLSFYCFYDHKIELIDEKTFFWSRLYQMFNHKLQKIKKYLIEHLNKKFILSSFVLYVSLILFIKKKDDSLHFCVNYRKFNALIKRNHYFLSLINEILACIQESKYLTQLNIMIIFNKL